MVEPASSSLSSVSIETVVSELDGIADFRLSDDLLGELVSVARRQRDAQNWQVEQANAWKTARRWQEARRSLGSGQTLNSHTSDRLEAAKTSQLSSTIQEYVDVRATIHCDDQAPSQWDSRSNVRVWRGWRLGVWLMKDRIAGG